MTTAATEVSREIIDALVRLNVHARAFGSGKRAIYAYKILVSAITIVTGSAGVMLRQWTGKCHGCNGTGRYVDSYGETWPHCRKCRSTGTVTLKFVEVGITNGPLWHHPFDQSAGWDLARLAGVAIWDDVKGAWKDARGFETIFWNITDGWTPKQPAEQLNANAAAKLLNIVEPWVRETPLPFEAAGRLRWLGECAQSEMRRYTLSLGRLDGPCFRCGSSDVVVGLGCSGPPFEFATPVCRTHERIEPAFWPKSVPESALTPALREWRDRHVTLGFERREW